MPNLKAGGQPLVGGLGFLDLNRYFYIQVAPQLS
jgi:hypothetical protein